MNKKNIAIFAIIAIVVAIVILKNQFASNDYTLSVENAVSAVAENEATTETTDNSIKIHITGEVQTPGLIELQAGDRISDAIEKAGGLTSQADTSKVNLAYILSDGEKIYIPSVNDDDDVNYILTETSSTTKININTATSEQLQTLSGIGESTAEAIISYREQNGKFSSIEDIKNVSGIGDSKFEKIKDNICVK